MTIYMIADNIETYRKYKSGQRQKLGAKATKGFYYVTTEPSLRGRRHKKDDEVRLIGEWWEKRNLSKILDTLKLIEMAPVYSEEDDLRFNAEVKKIAEGLK